VPGPLAVPPGVAFIAITAAVAVFANLGQALTTRLGPRPVLSAGLLLTAAGCARGGYAASGRTRARLSASEGAASLILAAMTSVAIVGAGRGR
jgi:hypothetical protein